MWREIEKGETELLTQAARFEKEFPKFYRDASATWTTNEDEILRFYERCERLYGVFDEEDLIGLVYLERISGVCQTAHLDTKRGADQQALVDAFSGIRDRRFAEGTTTVETWVLRQNRQLRAMLESIGFIATGLEMSAGRSHARILRWVRLIIRSEEHE